MPRIDHHAAVSTLRARYNLARRVLERGKPDAPRLEALDALQGALESLSPSTLSCASWQRMALVLFRLAFSEATEARSIYAGGLLVYCYSTGVSWQGAWKDVLLDAA